MKTDQNSRKRVAILFGGRSSEHEISIITALQMLTALDTLKYEPILVYLHPNGKWFTGIALNNKSFYRNFSEKDVQEVTLLPDPHVKGLTTITQKRLGQVIPIDFYFLAFHGQYGEDGCIQGLLEMANATYTGCGVVASAVAMNKYFSKQILGSLEIPVLPSMLVLREEAQRDLQVVQQRILTTRGFEQFPLFVKPCHLGSSIAINKVTNLTELNAALANVFRFDDEALVEPCLTNILEINVAVLGEDPPLASVVEIPMASGGALTYEDKYLRGGNKSSGNSSSGMASLTRVIDPIDLDKEIKELVIKYALKGYQALGCSGVSRFDFMLDLTSGQLYFNEINPIPGSLAFYLWEKSSPAILYNELIERMINQAFRRKGARLSLQRDFGFKALK